MEKITPLSLLFVIVSGVIAIAIAFWIILFDSPEDRKTRLDTRCQEQFPNWENVSRGDVGNGVNWCLSISESGVTQIGVLED